MADVQKQAKTIADMINEPGEFTSLSAFLEQADLMDTLKEEGPFTLFAPTDDAFRRLPRQTREVLKQPASHDRLQRTLKHHVVEGRHSAAEVAEASSLTMMDETTVSIETKGRKVHIGEASVTQKDREAGNGLIHVINRVLMPE
jgi:uncharacterized surface protein with fasciclin (FAS1) repeats